MKNFVILIRMVIIRIASMIAIGVDKKLININNNKKAIMQSTNPNILTNIKGIMSSFVTGILPSLGE